MICLLSKRFTARSHISNCGKRQQVARSFNALNLIDRQLFRRLKGFGHLPHPDKFLKRLQGSLERVRDIDRLKLIPK